MPDFTGLKFLRTIKTGKGLIKLIINLRLHRRQNKVDAKRAALSKKRRIAVYEKTNGRCHICGIEVAIIDFHADHVQSHITDGEHADNSYLPSCRTCNVLRWHYSPEEMQLIIKMGRWLKTKLLEETDESLSLANQFVKNDMALRKRRKSKA